MGNINTRNLSAGLFQKAVESSQNGNISSTEKNALNQLAQKDGVNADERRLLNGLENKNNLQTLKASAHEPQTIQFENKPSGLDTLKAAGADAKAQGKFQKLSGSQQQQFLGVLSKSSKKADLLKLLGHGTMTQKDSKGKTTLHNLNRLQNGPHKSGVRGTQLADDAIARLRNRNCIKQGPHGTCGAGSVQYAMMGKDPAEVVRMVADLAEKGKTTTRGGHTLNAGTGSLNWHKGDKTTDGSSENRDDFDIIFQSAAMRSMALVGGDMDIILGGAADYNVNKDNGDGKSVATGDSASDPLFVHSMMENISGKDYDSDSLWGTYGEMKTHANQGKEPIALYSTGGGGMHYVTVKSVKNGNVNFYCTAWGKMRSMPEDEFKGKLMRTITPD